MKKNEGGFSAIEALIVIIAIGLIGFVGWYVWQNKSNDDTAKETASESAPRDQFEAYKRTTAVPNDWKTYSNDKYIFSISHPANWEVYESSGTLSEGSTATDKDFFSLGFRPFSTGSKEIQYQFNVSHETMAQAVAERKRIASENTSVDDGIKLTITSEKYFTYDGYKAVRFDMTSDDGTAPDSFASEIYIVANDLLYKFDTSFHDNNAFQDKDVLAVFESLKIQ